MEIMMRNVFIDTQVDHNIASKYVQSSSVATVLVLIKNN